MKRIPAAIVAGAVLSLFFLAIGFYLSNERNWPLSQSVGGAGFVILAISQLAAQLRGERSKSIYQRAIFYAGPTRCEHREHRGHREHREKQKKKIEPPITRMTRRN